MVIAARRWMTAWRATASCATATSSPSRFTRPSTTIATRTGRTITGTTNTSPERRHHPRGRAFSLEMVAEDAELYDLNSRAGEPAERRQRQLRHAQRGHRRPGFGRARVPDPQRDQRPGTDQRVRDERVRVSRCAGQHTYNSTGNPGLSVSLRFALEQRIGDVVGTSCTTIRTTTARAPSS